MRTPDSQAEDLAATVVAKAAAVQAEDLAATVEAKAAAVLHCRMLARP